ncbi:RNA polymerase sigma factor [Chryseobacterium koreense]|nr:sigma-70 family RNA polymerase sigma factor [Chryseobacterium koreense]MBB5332430.1 RNA polymerase sigma-70 factor (ECF subfamily) [Chryseobacterium koreense]
MNLRNGNQNHHLQFEDEKVVQRILQGDVGMFEILIRRYNPFLYKIGKTYGFSHQDIEDLMQDCYLSIYKNLEQFQERSSFKTWIAKIMLHLCYRNKQKSERMKNAISEEQSFFMSRKNEPFSQDGALVNKELGTILDEAIQGIPLNLRKVFVMREINGLNTTETANLLQITESNVKVRLSRAKEILRHKIGANYLPEELLDYHYSFCSPMVQKVMEKTVRQAKN